MSSECPELLNVVHVELDASRRAPIGEDSGGDEIAYVAGCDLEDERGGLGVDEGHGTDFIPLC